MNTEKFFNLSAFSGCFYLEKSLIGLASATNMFYNIQML